MKINVYELVEVVNKMVWKECNKRGLKADEDIMQEVLFRMWRWIKKNNGEVLETWTGYAWKAVNSVLNNLIREKYKRVNIIYLEDLKKEDEEEVDKFLIDVRDESFSVDVMKLVEKYKSIGEDFLRIITGDIEVSNALRSITQSRKRDIEWVEWWLGRKLSNEEMRCCEEIKAMLM